MSMTNIDLNSSRRFPDGFAKVRLRLAREPGHPLGSADYGYDLVVPLDKGGRIDAGQWKSHRELCRVVHYRSDEVHDVGHLLRQPGGQWSFHYDIQGDEDDAKGFHLGDERFVVGEYVAIIEDDVPHTYRVVTVDRL